MTQSNAASTMPEDTATLTPMMAQYVEIKQAHPDCVVLFRLGDFYEIFFDDAPHVASTLGIQLTRRNKNQNGTDIPMCGIPWHQLDNYLPQLIHQGFKVALVEQLEDPAEAKKRGPKAIVKRDVVRIVTAGTLTEDTLLSARSNNYILCLCQVKTALAAAWLDISTGEFQTQSIGIEGVAALLERIAPSEILLPNTLSEQPALFDVWRHWKKHLTVQASSVFHPINCLQHILDVYHVSTLDAFGQFTAAETTAAGALVRYVSLTQKGDLPALSALKKVQAAGIMHIDAATRKSLELAATQDGSIKGSLLDHLDQCQTAGGARLLKKYLSAPLVDAAHINARLDHVGYWMESSTARQSLIDILSITPDMERSLTRLSMHRGGPRDMAVIRDGLKAAEKLSSFLNTLDALPALALAAVQKLPVCLSLTASLEKSLDEDLPLLARDGGFIQPGCCSRLDELQSLRKDGVRLIRNLEAKYREATGNNSLKIKHNNVLGYFVEVNAKHADTMAEPFIHRQTLANAARFTTVELSNLQKDILQANHQVLAIELELFAQLEREILQHTTTLKQTAESIAVLDVASSLASLASEQRYCKPAIDDSQAFDIHAGRHPVVEKALYQNSQSAFTPNDCALQGDAQLWLLTGPNMAGKSTYLRQNALITIMAQMGGFVPASAAHIGVVDAVFSRVGAADDLAQGRSTFMVEMVETAAIVRQATNKSLVILDEIGRGTATYDGLSIAWATLEHLHSVNQCRTLFATHYHELGQLTSSLDSIAAYTMSVEETATGIVFLHRVKPGEAERSYGIFVAQLAGMPAGIVARSTEILQRLEATDAPNSLPKSLKDLPLFTPNTMPPVLSMPGPSKIEEHVQHLDVDTLSPREALDVLYQLKSMV